MAKNRSSSFNAADGLFSTQDVHEVQQAQYTQEVQKEIGTTQGKKGQN